MKTRITLITVLLMAVSCNTLKDIARTVDDLGDMACEIFGAENPDEFEHLVRSVMPPGAVADAEKSGFDPRVLCSIKEVVQPFIDNQLRLQQSTAASQRRSDE
jgi:hypothetical protein